MNKPTEEQIREVLAGTSTPETARLVAQWFATDEGTDYLSRSMDCDVEQVKLGYEELYVDHEIASDELFARIRRNIRRKRVRRIVFRVAAVLIPFVVLAGLVVQLDKRVDLFGGSGYEEIYVAKGERLQMMFQDGTRVYINSDSRLKYPKKFALSSREVYLEGEAYFVVSKNPARPFIVNLNGPAIHVLGTSLSMPIPIIRILPYVWMRGISISCFLRTRNIRCGPVKGWFIIATTTAAPFPETATPAFPLYGKQM